MSDHEPIMEDDPKHCAVCRRPARWKLDELGQRVYYHVEPSSVKPTS